MSSQVINVTHSTSLSSPWLLVSRRSMAHAQILVRPADVPTRPFSLRLWEGRDTLCNSLVVKWLSFKISPPKAFEGDCDYERVATWLQKVENFFRAIAVKEHQRLQTAAGLLGGDLVGGVYQRSKDC